MNELNHEYKSFVQVKESITDVLSDSSTFSNDEADSVTRKKDDKSHFSHSASIIVSCLGCVVGTGNVWRFPRIIASASSDQGSLAFVLLWLFFLFTWSVPLVVTEYTLGRFTRNSPLVAFQQFFGPKFLWMGGWITAVSFLVGAYYSNVISWCFYYFYVACAWPELPSTEPESRQIFEDLINTYWPLGLLALEMLLAGIAVLKGVRGIEFANCFMVPLLLIIIVATFYWSLSRQYAELGVSFIFTLDWSMFTDPKVYVEAACQNAYDTGAAMGLFTAYATYLSRSDGAVRYGTILPMLNNLVSFVCGVTIFATVFSSLIQTQPTMTFPQIVMIMKESGPGGTGLTLTWIPLLMSKLGITGRILCGLFFLCLSFAGVTSMISQIELTTRAIQEFRVKRLYAATAAIVATFLAAVPSSLNIDILRNQDFVWGFSLMISGICYCSLVIHYGPIKYRRVLANDFGLNDWKLVFAWIILIVAVVPLEAVGLLSWWIYSNIAFTSDWYLIRAQSLITAFLEWVILFILLGGINLLVYFCKWSLSGNTSGQGYDPYSPELIPPACEILNSSLESKPDSPDIEVYF